MTNQASSERVRPNMSSGREDSFKEMLANQPRLSDAITAFAQRMAVVTGNHNFAISVLTDLVWTVLAVLWDTEGLVWERRDTREISKLRREVEELKKQLFALRRRELLGQNTVSERKFLSVISDVHLAIGGLRAVLAARTAPLVLEQAEKPKTYLPTLTALTYPGFVQSRPVSQDAPRPSEDARPDAGLLHKLEEKDDLISDLERRLGEATRSLSKLQATPAPAVVSPPSAHRSPATSRPETKQQTERPPVQPEAAPAPAPNTGWGSRPLGFLAQEASDSDESDQVTITLEPVKPKTPESSKKSPTLPKPKPADPPKSSAQPQKPAAETAKPKTEQPPKPEQPKMEKMAPVTPPQPKAEPPKPEPAKPKAAPLSPEPPKPATPQPAKPTEVPQVAPKPASPKPEASKPAKPQPRVEEPKAEVPREEPAPPRPVRAAPVKPEPQPVKAEAPKPTAVEQKAEAPKAEAAVSPKTEPARPQPLKPDPNPIPKPQAQPEPQPQPKPQPQPQSQPQSKPESKALPQPQPQTKPQPRPQPQEPQPEPKTTVVKAEAPKPETQEQKVRPERKAAPAPAAPAKAAPVVEQVLPRPVAPVAQLAPVARVPSPAPLQKPEEATPPAPPAAPASRPGSRAGPRPESSESDRSSAQRLLAAKDEEILQLEAFLASSTKKNEELERRLKTLEVELDRARQTPAPSHVQRPVHPPPVATPVVVPQAGPDAGALIAAELALAEARKEATRLMREWQDERDGHEKTRDKLREAELSLGELKEKLTDLTSLLRHAGLKDKELHDALHVSGLHKFMLGELDGVFERLYRDALRRMDKIKFLKDKIREKNEEELLVMMNALTNPGSFSATSTAAQPTRTPSTGMSRNGRPVGVFKAVSRARSVTPFGLRSRSITPEGRTTLTPEKYRASPKRSQMAAWMFPSVVPLRPFFPHTPVKHV